MDEEVKNLLEELKSSDWTGRCEAAWALGKIGDNSPGIIAGLCEAINDSHEDVRY